MPTHIVVVCATGCLDVQIAQLNCQVGLKQPIKFHMHRMVAWCAWVCCCSGVSLHLHTHCHFVCYRLFFDVQIAELSAQLGLKQRILHAQDGCIVFMDVLLL